MTDSARPETDTHTDTGDTDARIRAIFERHRETILAQVDDIEQAAAAAVCGALDEDSRANAERQAHKIAGSAGTFGFPKASELSRQLENEFRDFDAESDAPRRIAGLALSLRESLDAAPQVEESPPTDTVIRPVVLLVDSDGAFCAEMAEQASASGMTVLVARTPLAARRHLQVGLDAALIGIDDERNADASMALIEELSNEAQPVPCLVLTSRGSFTDRVEVVRRGARGFLQKPMPTSQALAAARELLDRSRVDSMTVLALDDDPLMLHVIQLVLAARNINVVPVSDSALFWDELERVQPDLLLLDVNLPDIDGIELCQVVRSDARWTDMPILFLTADSRLATMGRIFASGADDFVRKPLVGPELLMRTVSRLERLRTLRHHVDTDSLTGLVNRHKFVESTNRLLHLSDRYDQPLSIALVDLDGLRAVNDRHGHLMGDRVLRDLGTQLLASFRGEDVVGRWTGSEMIIAMYGMRQEDGVQRVADMLETFRARSFDGADGSTFNVTFSAGVVELSPVLHSLDALCRSAEDATRAAKQAGRNRVLGAGSDATESQVAMLDIVLVEDDEALASLLLHSFETRGLRVLHIADGGDAIAQLPDLTTRVVVLDWDLPGASGLSVLRTLAANGALSTTKVLMLTGHTAEGDVLRALELGAADHVAKPFSVPILMQRLRRLLDDTVDAR
jgi:diguanylate cyclase (GGDEF)-like protein